MLDMERVSRRRFREGRFAGCLQWDVKRHAPNVAPYVIYSRGEAFKRPHIHRNLAVRRSNAPADPVTENIYIKCSAI